MLYFFYFLIFIWTALEASFWWVAPDISMAIAYLYFPKYWKRFVLIGVFGAFAGCLITYVWASYFPDAWLSYVSGMRFHSEKNIAYVQKSLLTDPLSIIKGAWGGIPFKLFFGEAAILSKSFISLAPIGILSRLLRFLFVLWVTKLIRYFSSPWSHKHPTQLSMILLLIWMTMILLFDIFINQLFL